ncbi:hypothetical protein ABZ639_29040 [Saccharomonospora sp. NPDC006951]
MNVGVLKFGGSTFATPSRYAEVADLIRRRAAETGAGQVVVVSAMPGDTERLRERVHAACAVPGQDALVSLLPMADTMSALLLAAALNAGERVAEVLPGPATGFTTTGSALWGTLTGIDPAPLRDALRRNRCVILPGGQASDRSGRPTWLGKNSSDLSAVAAAVATGAARCEIFSDVEGVYSCDPRVVAESRLLGEIPYALARRLTRYGAKVLHPGAVRLAARHDVRIVCAGNTPPYRRGSVIGDAGPAEGRGAVVLNRLSRAFAYPSPALAEDAAAALAGEGINALATRAGGGPVVLVIGGYVDLGEVGERLGVALGDPAGIPVIEIVGERAEVHLAEDEEASVALARSLHARLLPLLARS